MNRREFLGRSTTATLGIGLRNRLLGEPHQEKGMLPGGEATGAILPGTAQPVLAGTTPLTTEGDLAMQMVDGIHRYLLNETERQVMERGQLWNRDYTSVEHYERSIAPNRQRFRQIIGAVDTRVEAQAPQLLVGPDAPEWVAQGSGYKVYAIRWPVFAGVTADSNGLEAEGLLLQPEGLPAARIVAIPDADWTPESLVGLEVGITPGAQFAR